MKKNLQTTFQFNWKKGIIEQGGTSNTSAHLFDPGVQNLDAKYIEGANAHIKRAMVVEGRKSGFITSDEVDPILNIEEHMLKNEGMFGMNAEDIQKMCEGIQPDTSALLPKKLYYSSFHLDEHTKLGRNCEGLVQEYVLRYLKNPLHYLLGVLEVDKEWDREITSKIHAYLKNPSTFCICACNIAAKTMFKAQIDVVDNAFTNPVLSFYHVERQLLNFDTSAVNLLC